MSVTLSLFAGAGAQFLDNAGNVLTGGKIYTYAAGTTTNQATYTSVNGNIFHPNPIILDAAGRVPGGEIWLSIGVGYKFVVKDANDVLIATYDNIPSAAQSPAANDADSIMYEQGYVVTAGSFIIGSTYRIASIGTTNFTLIGATFNTVGTHFIATGVGTGTGTAELSQTVQTKLRQTVSVKDFGAVGDGVTDDTAAIQAALDQSIHVYMPDGVYLCNTEAQLRTNGNFLEGSGNAVIVQNTYSFSGIQIRASDCTVKNIIFKNLQAKTVLSTSLPDRYEGQVLRARSAAIYVAAGANNFTSLQCEAYGFVCGVNFSGGEELVWRTNIPSTYTTTSFILAPEDQRPDGYWVGAVARIMTVGSASTAPFIITGYTNFNNTITFVAQVAITSANFYYFIYKGLTNTGRIEQFYMDKIDFGVLAQYSENIVMTEMVAQEIEQTQQINARPHTIYVTGYSKNVTATNLTTYKCPNGQAYKFRSVNNLYLGNVYASDSRGVFTIENCLNASAVDCAGFDAGETPGFAPTIGDITNSKNVFVNSCSLVVSPNYNGANVAADRPYGISVYSTGVIIDAEQPQTINEQINIKDISITAGNAIDLHYGVLLDGDSSTPSELNNFVTVDGLTMYGSGLNARLEPVRIVRGQNTICENLQVQNNGTGTVTLQADTDAINTLFLLNPDLITTTSITNTGTNTAIRYVADIESGSWTPVIIGSTTAGTNTYTSQIGTYYKIGNQVMVRCRVILSGALDSTGQIRVSGLPFTASNISGAAASGFMALPSSVSNVTLSSGEIFTLKIDGGVAYVALAKISNTGVANLSDTAFGSDLDLAFEITYLTS